MDKTYARSITFNQNTKYQLNTLEKLMGQTQSAIIRIAIDNFFIKKVAENPSRVIAIQSANNEIS